MDHFRRLLLTPVEVGGPVQYDRHMADVFDESFTALLTRYRLPSRFGSMVV